MQRNNASSRPELAPPGAPHWVPRGVTTERVRDLPRGTADSQESGAGLFFAFSLAIMIACEIPQALIVWAIGSCQ